MNTLAADIRDMIVAETTWVAGTNLFIRREPTMPNICLTIFETPGIGSLLFMNKDGRYDRGNIQLRLRNPNSEQGMTQMQELIDILHGEGNFELNGAVYTKIEALDSPALLDWDENNRARIITNFEIQRRPELVPET